jgi:hypothetical protein
MIEVNDPKLTEVPAEIKYFNYGLAITHNYPCPVLYNSDEKAVCNLHDGTFHPSWKAQEAGWKLIKADTWFRKQLLKFFETL